MNCKHKGLHKSTVSSTDLDPCWRANYFESIFTTFEASFIFWGSLGSNKNLLELKIEPPLADLDCLNRWNTLHNNRTQNKKVLPSGLTIILIFVSPGICTKETMLALRLNFFGTRSSGAGSQSRFPLVSFSPTISFTAILSNTPFYCVCQGLWPIL